MTFKLKHWILIFLYLRLVVRTAKCDRTLTLVCFGPLAPSVSGCYLLSGDGLILQNTHDDTTILSLLCLFVACFDLVTLPHRRWRQHPG